MWRCDDVEIGWKIDYVAHMSIVSVHQAEAEFSELLKRAEAGELIEIARRDRVVATLVPKPPTETGKRRGYGAWKGQVKCVGDLAEPLTHKELGFWEDNPLEPSH